ncbi:MAG TPA: hypothetical protein VJA17_03890, partial [Candidatus Omnitrophota bacterium]|nr:hypothetical protein [Candidatus Omnitrophota bacterium]
VLFVSHNIAALASISETAMVLESGKIVFRGPIQQGIDQYLGGIKAYTAEAFFSKPSDLSAPIRFRYVALLDEKRELAETHLLSARIQIVIEYEVTKPIKRAQVVCHIWNLKRVHILSSADIDCQPQLQDLRQPGIYRVEISLPASLLAPGSYQIELACGIPNQGVFDMQEGPQFEVSAVGSYAVHWSGARQDVVVGLPLPWKMDHVRNSIHE